MNDDHLLERIAIDPDTMVAKPIIRGARLTADYILGLLGHGTPETEICQEYSGVTQEDIQACQLVATKALKDTDFMPLAS